MTSGLWIAAADERADARRSCSRRNPPVPSLGWQSSGAPDDWPLCSAPTVLGIAKSASRNPVVEILPAR